MEKKREFNCTIEASMCFIGGKYKPIILWHLVVYHNSPAFGRCFMAVLPGKSRSYQELTVTPILLK